MARRSIGIVVAAVVWLALATVAHAAGLGRLTVLSPLGQPLLAEIEIVSLQPGEEEGLSARLAAPEAFEQAGIEINPALNSLRINLERRDKRPFLRVTTSQPVNEPFLDILIELSWSSGRLVREYTFLLDPPEYRSRQQAIAAAPLPPVAEKPAPTPAAEPTPAEPAAPQPAPEATPSPAPAPQAAPQAEAPAKPAANTYEVKRGDTLGAIARQNLKPGVTLNQMLIAIFRANGDAFIKGNVNLVRTGKILTIPDIDSLGTIDREEANQLVKEHHEQFMEYRNRLAAVATRRNDHLYLTAISEAMHGVPRLIVEITLRVVVLGVACCLIWYGYLNYLRGFGSFRLPSGTPIASLYAVIPLSGVLIALFTIEQLVNGIRNGFDHPEPREDELDIPPVDTNIQTGVRS